MKNYNDENNLLLVGELSEEPVFNHEVHNEKFFTMNIITKRKSDVVDILPVLVSEKILPSISLKEPIKVTGQLRTYNRFSKEENKSKLMILPFAREIENISEEELSKLKDTNVISLEGFVCREPIKRETPKKRVITDLTIAVNRAYRRSDYIPSIAWGREAVFASTLNIGDQVKATGRLQSREYKKILEDETTNSRIAYEFSINKLSLLEATPAEITL